jgi:uncharacterized protein
VPLDINTRIANSLNIQLQQVSSTVTLLDDGASVPFIARYRKEATGGLDDIQLRNLVEQLTYLRELDARRTTILNSITEQGKLTEELAAAINNTDNKTALEDLYLPYKPKRRVKAQIAREAGLEPLALDLLANHHLNPEIEAAKYLNPEHNIVDTKSALDGAKFIIMELMAENADVLAKIRNNLWQTAMLTTNVIEGKAESGVKFADYFSFNEPIKSIPSHRVLAAMRGANEKILSLSITLSINIASPNEYEHIILDAYNINPENNANNLAGHWLYECVKLCFKTKIFVSLETEILSQLRENADLDAIKVFSTNLHNLLLQAPIGNKSIIGLDPGIRTGVKVAAIDNTGKLLDTCTIYPFQPHNKYVNSIETLAALIKKYQIELISIGNGTASRETENLVNDMLKQYPELNVGKVMVSEAGASVYSASEFASIEFPNLDVSLRGAVSIARRLQDPLAELVKIDPKAIGVGQYQHDVNQNQLSQALINTVEDCVNSVGVDLNTASIPLLTHVSGLNATIAKNIVSYRDKHGKYTNRNQLKEVSRLGEKAFEQSAGFLKILDGDNMLDSSAVHPESYPLVALIAKKLNTIPDQLIANNAILKNIKPTEFVSDGYGLPTIIDVLHELEKPGRDPRGTFKTAQFKDGVNSINDLTAGMVLEGIVTNVTNFGAFVDIGVHQDGLVHISEITNRFISNPSEILKTGQIVRVTVLQADSKRHRISLSMKSASSTHNNANNKNNTDKNSRLPQSQQQQQNTSKSAPVSAPANPMTALSAAFAKTFPKKTP